MVCDMMAMIIYEDGSTGLQRPVLSSTAAVVPSSVSPSESVRRPKYIQVIGLGQQRSPTTDLVTIVFPLHPQVLGVSFEYPCVNPALDESAGLLALAAFHPVDLPSAVVNVPRCKTFPTVISMACGPPHGALLALRVAAC